MMENPDESIERPGLPDPVEEVLALAGARARLVATLVGHGDWSLAFPAPAGAKFNAVTEGSCVLTVPGREPVALRTGDVFLLTRPTEFVLSTSPGAAVQPASPYFRGPDRRAAVVGPPSEPVSARLVGGSFEFDGRARQLLLDWLPPVIHLPGHADGAAEVRRMLDRVDRELRDDGFGARLVAQHTAMVMLVDLLRHLVASGAEGRGWLRGLAEPVTAAALRAMHADPAHHWTVQQLARTAHVSRSTLAARFKKAVGQGPLEYLTQWRIELGADRLARTEESVAMIARAVGYGSEAAFGLAFKRATGQAPGAYRKQVRSVSGRTDGTGRSGLPGADGG
ncbi:AraC family transcriptional regulator [Streptomyces misionensis]|uniref:AraC family transcriptional regulator n=1 Tax=Streptomyces misionensis TaxID=67331 RepID=UPI00339FC595